MKEELPEIPEYIKELLESGQSIDEIRLDKNGNWFHNGEPFTNKKIIDFFNRSINMTGDGIYVLHYDEYTYPIVVEDAPFFISGLRFEGFGDFEKIYINLSNGTEEELDYSTLHYKSNNVLYCRVLNNTFLAKFKRSPNFHLLERLDEIEGTYYLNICGKKILLNMDDTL